MHSFDASTMNFREVVQHTSPLNKLLLAFSYTILRANLRHEKVLENGGLRPWRPQFCCHNHEFWEVVQHTSPLNKLYWHFLIKLQGKPRAQEGAGKWIPEAKVSTVVEILT